MIYMLHIIKIMYANISYVFATAWVRDSSVVKPQGMQCHRGIIVLDVNKM